MQVTYGIVKNKLKGFLAHLWKIWKAHVEKFSFIDFENPLYISPFLFGEKEGKDIGICC